MNQTIPTPATIWSTFSNHVDGQLGFYQNKYDQASKMMQQASCDETRTYFQTQLTWLNEVIMFLQQWDNRVPEVTLAPNNVYPSATKSY